MDTDLGGVWGDWGPEVIGSPIATVSPSSAYTYSPSPIDGGSAGGTLDTSGGIGALLSGFATDAYSVWKAQYLKDHGLVQTQGGTQPVYTAGVTVPTPTGGTVWLLVGLAVVAGLALAHKG